MDLLLVLVVCLYLCLMQRSDFDSMRRRGHYYELGCRLVRSCILALVLAIC